MAIIYSYENNNELLRSDKLVGTAATLYNGKFRRITKNFTLGQLSDFINLQFTNNIEEWVTDNFVPKVRTLSINGVTYDLSANRSWTIDTGGQNLQEVTDIGNVTTNPILIPQLQLYDTSNDAYSSINYSDGQFNLYDTDGRLIKVFEKNGLEETKNQNDFTLLKNVTLLTANRTRTEPNKDGTYAMLDDILPSAWKEPAELLLLNADVVQGGGLPQISGLTIQGYTLVQGSRVVVTEYNVPAFNGIYRVAAGPLIPTGNYTLVRTNDANSGNELNNAVIGITNGTFSGKTYRQTTANPVINTTAINFVDFAVTSVGMTVPSAFNVTPSTITSSGTFSITGAGSASQYVRGDGTLANFPTSSGGGASVSYYLNGSISQGTIGGVEYKEMNSVPVIGAGTDFTINTNGYIAQFITDAGDPNKLLIPGGNWNFETYFSASSGGGSPRFYIELYKYDGSVFTLIASNSATPKLINDGTSIEAYFSALAVPPTTLLATDRLAVRFYVINSGRTITMHTENSHLCQVITTFSTGLTALNGLTQQVQYFAVGTSGIDFNISSATDTHTFNLPTASAINRGALSSADWTTFNNKLNSASPSYTGLMTGVGTTQTGISAIGVLDLSQTWNTTGTPTAIRLNVTDTTSNANSLLMDLQVGGSSRFRVEKAGIRASNALFLGGLNTVAGILPQGTLNQETLLIRSSVFTSTTGVTDIRLSNGQGDPTFTSGTRTLVSIDRNFSPTSGNGNYTLLNIPSTINQTGGANGITRGLFINPTLTSAADFRAIETTVGNVILGSTSGNVGIGTTSPQSRLDVRAQGALSTDIAFRVRNSANTADLISVNGIGRVGIGLASPAGKLDVFDSTDSSIYCRIGSVGANWQTGTTLSQFGTFTNHPLVFKTNDQARMRIDASGNVLINTTTTIASSRLTVESTTQGVLLPRMTTAQRDAIVSPAVGLQIFNTTAGYLEYFDSFWGWMPIDNSNEWKRKNGTEYFNDFGNNNTFSDGVFQTFPVNGGGALTFSPIPNTNDYIGYQGLSTGVNTNGGNGIRTDLNAGRFFIFNCGRKSFTSRIWVQALSTITDRYTILNGFSNSNNTTITSGAAFIYDEGGVGTGTTASPNWQIITANVGVRTNFVTSVPVNITTWYSFRIETNANDTEVYYYINDVLVRTETTNIPAGGVSFIQPIISINKNTGTTNRGIVVDYLGLKIKLNNQR
jgi:hypothetical protein